MKNERLRILFIIVTFVVSGFLITSLTSYHAARDSLSEQISETALPLTSDTIYSEIQRDLLEPIFISSLMAQDTFVRDWKLDGERNPDRMIRYLKEIQNTYNTVTSFFISDATKTYYHPTGILKTISREDEIDDWYFDFRAREQEYEINLDHDTADPTSLTVFINYRVTDYEGNFIGVTGVGLSVNQIHERIDRIQKRFGRTVSFFDRTGQIMMSSDISLIGKSIKSDPNLSDISEALLEQTEGSFSYQREGKTIFLNSRLVEEFQWFLIVEQGEASIESRISSNLASNLAISFVISLIVVLITHLALSRSQKRLESMATTDKLTGIPNRHVFDTIYDQIAKSAKRHKHITSFAMLDIDHFKQINDTFGHHAGDFVLKEISGLIKNMLRESDTICRWGGEEFLLIFPECQEAAAHEICENIRQKIENHAMTYQDKTLSISVSIGVSAMALGETADPILCRIDNALYDAKSKGRNRVQSHKGGS